MKFIRLRFIYAWQSALILLLEERRKNPQVCHYRKLQGVCNLSTSRL